MTMWLKYEAKGGSLTTMDMGRRITLRPGDVVEFSDAEGANLVASGLPVVEVDAPEASPAVEPVEEVAEVAEAEEVAEEPVAMGEMTLSVGTISVNDIPAGGRKSKRG